MRAIGLIIRTVVVIAILIVGGFLAVIGIFSWSDGNVAAAHGQCSMRIVEQKIEEGQQREYLRNCMKAEGYSELYSCYVDGNTVASCFLPRWMFWINKADF